MEGLRMSFLMVVFLILFSLIISTINAQASVPAPAPSSDGATIDQGVAYVLMMVALALTYIMH